MNLEIENFILPIASDNPFGDYLKRHPKVIKLKELRSSNLAMDNLDKGIWAKKNEIAPNWQSYLDLCEEILIEDSKDLQVCSYYAEAQSRVNGFNGLNFALLLILHFCKNNWEDIYPPLEEDNLELRLSPFHWLEINLPISIRCISFAPNMESESENVLTWDKYERAMNIGTEEGIRVKNEILNLMKAEDSSFIAELHESLTSILNSLEQLEEFVIEISDKCGEKTTLESVLKLCQEICSFIEPLIDENKEENLFDYNLNEEDEFSGTENKQFQNKKQINDFSFDGNIDSIEKAYAIIENANQYLMKVNPHSPAPYLIRRALDWQKKSLYDVFMELFTTTSKPSEIFTLLGLSEADKINKG